MKVTTWSPFDKFLLVPRKKTWLDGVYRSRGTIPTMWPPTVISSFLNPNDYSHKLTREFHLVPQGWTKYKFVTIINNSYWNYVNQLSYRLGAPHCKNNWAFRSSPPAPETPQTWRVSGAARWTSWSQPMWLPGGWTSAECFGGLPGCEGGGWTPWWNPTKNWLEKCNCLGPPVMWMLVEISPVTIVISTIRNWSYVHQLSYCLGAPLCVNVMTIFITLMFFLGIWMDLGFHSEPIGYLEGLPGDRYV